MHTQAHSTTRQQAQHTVVPPRPHLDRAQHEARVALGAPVLQQLAHRPVQLHERQQERLCVGRARVQGEQTHARVV
jgi:hypothetical protein